MSCGRAVAMGERGADAVTIAALTELIATSGARAVAVIGLVKNAGKTTVVNALLAQDGRVYGLTSLGLDGEKVDHLTGLAKPRIAPPRGTLVATTRGSLDRSHYALEVLEELPFVTPLGRVVIGRAGEGEVEVSGPTTLAELRTTVERLGVHGAGQVLVDGAINRLGQRLAARLRGGRRGDRRHGGRHPARGRRDDRRHVRHAHAPTGLRQGLLGQVDPSCCRRRAPSPSPRTATVTPLRVDTVIGEGVTVAREVERLGAETLFIGGALTRDFVEDFTRVLPPRRTLRIVVRDATVLVLPAATVALFRRRGIDLEVLRPLRVLAITVNPFRVPQPYQPKVFFNALSEALGERAPLFDVVNGLASVPDGETAAAPAVPA